MKRLLKKEKELKKLGDSRETKEYWRGTEIRKDWGT